MDQDGLYRLLAWLGGGDQEKCALEYEKIRSKLIRIFTHRECYEPEVLADETIDRVIKKLPEIQDTYVGDPALYFYGVARNVAKERCKNPPPPVPPPAPDPPNIKEIYDRCLTACLDRMNPADRKLMLDYFKYEGREKIEAHQATAEELGISVNALRTRAHRLKKTLRKCLLECIKRHDE